MEKFFETYKLKITTLTPVHIGCGEEYLPINYVIKNDYLTYADSETIFANFSERIKSDLDKELSGVVTANFLLKYAKLLDANKDFVAGISKFKVPVCQEFPIEYSTRLMEKIWNNDFAIARTCTNTFDYTSIIPGSSIKGAIRTAFIDFLRKQAPHTDHESIAKEIYQDRKSEKLKSYIQDLMGYKNMAEDKMKYLKLEDVNMGSSENRRVYYAVNYRKNGSVRNGKELATRLEAINFNKTGSFLVNIVKRDKIESSLEYTSDPELKKLYVYKHQIDKIQSINELAKICNQMFMPLFEDELNTLLDSKNINDFHYNRLFDVLDDVEANKSSKFLLKVGKHSGAEGVTLGNRKIKVMGKGRQYYMANNSTTFWLASEVKPKNNQMLPFGWVLCEIC